MRLHLARLSKPLDPVAAVHRASGDADAALARLQSAGFRRENLTVVGQASATLDPATLAARPAGAASHWAASGLGLGLLWAVFVGVAVLLHSTGSAAILLLAAATVLTLSLQALVMGHVVAPGQAAQPPAPPARQAAASDAATASPAWRYMVVVHGSRADVALARDLLANG